MVFKVVLFTSIILLVLVGWIVLLQKKGHKIDYRLMVSYFIFGSWFGMYGELFLFRLIDLIFHAPIWEYRTLPIHNKITSSYGPVMWGLSAVFIYLHHKHSGSFFSQKNKFLAFVHEAGYLLVLELLFNLLAYAIFNDYFFYYFVPDLWHWTSFTNMPFWWIGYKMIVKYGAVMSRKEKLNIAIAIVLLVVVYSPT